LHFGHGFNHDLRGAWLTAGVAALRAARVIASARATAHCGCVPDEEYDALPHTGQIPLAGAAGATIGFFSLKVSAPGDWR